MADEPISALTLIGPPTSGYAANFTTNNPTGGAGGAGGAQLEILDTTNTTMASTGTNSRIFPGDLIKGYLAAGSNVTLTETSGIVTVAASSPTTSYIFNSTLSSSPYTITTSYANVGLSIAIPGSGFYMVVACVRTQLGINSSVLGDQPYILTRIYDTTNAAVVSGSVSLANVATNFWASNFWNSDQVIPIGPLVYNASGAATLNLQAMYAYSGGGTITPLLISDSNGSSSLFAMRIA